MRKYIEGSDRYQQVLFPDVIDDYITKENPVRVIDAYIDGLPVGKLGFRAEPCATGRPSFDPKDMIKLFLYGYFNRVRSSRRLETETTRNVELMWLIKKLSPDHKTIARFRKDNAGALKNIFRDFVKLCQKLGLYGNELAAIDGSKFRAVNSTDNNFDRKKLEDRIRRIDEKLEQYLAELAENDEAEAENTQHTKEEIAAMVSALGDRKQGYELMAKQLEEGGKTQISTTDEDARRMKVAGGGSEVSYNIQTAVDAKHKLIITYDVTNRCNDKNLLAHMAKSAKETLGVDELTVLADAGFFVPTDIAECIRDGITPHVSSKHESITICVPASEEEAAEPGNEPRAFNNPGKPVFIKDRNIGLCPMGQIFYPKSYSKCRGAAVYSNAKACRNCPQRAACASYYDRELKVTMPKSAFTKDCDDQGLHVKQVTVTADKALLRRRKEIVEHPFGTIKRHMATDHCLLKGIEKVAGEFALTFLAYNLKRAINILGVCRLLQAVRV